MTIVSVKEEAKDEPRIRDLMVQWQNWRDERRKETLAQLGYGETFLKKCLDDMPGTVCPLCRGKNHECHICDGSGRIDLDPEVGLMNPAFIRATSMSKEDDTSTKIDRIMCELRRNQKTLGYYLILLQEYTRIGTQQIKAGRINISWGAYKTKLSRAHRAVEERL